MLGGLSKNGRTEDQTEKVNSIFMMADSGAVVAISSEQLAGMRIDGEVFR